MLIGRDSWSKYESLEYLKEKKYNTPDFRLARNMNELEKIVAEWGDDDRISVRSFIPNSNLSFNEPFYPNVKMTNTFKINMGKHLSEGYHLIVARGIDPVGTLYKGNIMIYPSFSMRRFDFIIECTPGYGTVRDLEKSKEIQSYTNLQDAMEVMGYHIQKIFIAAKDIFSDMDRKSIVLEWSIYDFPVGFRKKHIIYWEVRNGIDHVS